MCIRDRIVSAHFHLSFLPPISRLLSHQVSHRTILLLADAAQLREAKCTGLRLRGILVEKDGTGARQNLMELCARLGGPFLDGAQVKKLMLRHDGCVALKANTWSESTFTALQPLPVEQRGAYCVLKTVELVYLLCSCLLYTSVLCVPLDPLL